MFSVEIDVEHDKAMMNMATGITVTLLVTIIAPAIIFAVRRMIGDIQIFAIEAREKQKVGWIRM